MGDIEAIPFDEAESRKLQLLEDFLDRQAGDEAMTLEELDGFFAALHCCPVVVLPSEYLPEVLGTAGDIGEAFVNEEHARLILGLLSEHWNAVGKAFEKEFFIPLLLEDEEGKSYGNDWAIGFLRGIWMRKESWMEIMENEDVAGPFVPIFALAHENDSDPDLRPCEGPMTQEQRNALLAGMAGGVTWMYRYFEPHRKRAALGVRENAAFRRDKPRIGRNDLCYCGSGKKYKRCCYNAKVN